jgi:mono/diheme cytochrome c family protein
MPDNDKEAAEWKQRHGTPYGEEHYNWNYRELWDLPMIRSKFLQMSCRRCHKDAVELEGGEKYTAGMKLFERVGCYGCHRTESYLILDKDKKNEATPEQVKARRPGPPLTRIAVKTNEAWAAKWVLEPRGFRPTTRMPHFFGQSNTRTKVNGNPYPVDTVDGERRSPVDDAISYAIVKYLWDLSDKSETDPAPPANLKGDAARGASIVAQVGCMACHAVKDTPEAEFSRWKDKSRYLQDFAPSLGAVGSKITNRTWLYHLVRDPKKHFPDSAMPRLRLSEQEAMDVVEYLMGLKNADFDAKKAPPAPDEKLVNDLLLELLKAKMPAVDAERAVKGEHPQYPELKDKDGRIRFLGFRMVKNYGCYSCHELKRDDATK